MLMNVVKLQFVCVKVTKIMAKLSLKRKLTCDNCVQLLICCAILKHFGYCICVNKVVKMVAKQNEAQQKKKHLHSLPY